MFATTTKDTLHSYTYIDQSPLCLWLRLPVLWTCCLTNLRVQVESGISSVNGIAFLISTRYLLLSLNDSLKLCLNRVGSSRLRLDLNIGRTNELHLSLVGLNRHQIIQEELGLINHLSRTHIAIRWIARLTVGWRLQTLVHITYFFYLN